MTSRSKKGRHKVKAARQDVFLLLKPFANTAWKRVFLASAFAVIAIYTASSFYLIAASQKEPTYPKYEVDQKTGLRKAMLAGLETTQK